MRSFILSVCFACSLFVMDAQPTNGIHVHAGNNLVVVYLDGKQISLPTSSCFIANLKKGKYSLEVYDANAYRREKYNYRGKLLYCENIAYKGGGIQDLVIGEVNNRPFRPSYSHDSYGPDYYCQRGVLDHKSFDELLKALSDQGFDSSRQSTLEVAVMNSRFTSDQCVRIVKLFDFDSRRLEVMKQLYPVAVDKQNFFKVVNCLEFDSKKKEMNEFIKDYYKKHKR